MRQFKKMILNLKKMMLNKNNFIKDKYKIYLEVNHKVANKIIKTVISKMTLNNFFKPIKIPKLKSLVIKSSFMIVVKI